MAQNGSLNYTAACKISPIAIRWTASASQLMPKCPLADYAIMGVILMVTMMMVMMIMTNACAFLLVLEAKIMGW